MCVQKGKPSLSLFMSACMARQPAHTVHAVCPSMATLHDAGLQQGAAPGVGPSVAKAVQQAYIKQAGKNGKPQPNEHTVLAGICMTNSSDDSSVRVLALGTGTKCLGGSARSETGDLIHDSHAEALTRRAFMLWLHNEIRAAAQQHKQQQQQQQDNALCCIVFNADTRKFSMRPGIQLHMYVSQLPCGDACIAHQDAIGEATASVDDAAKSCATVPPATSGCQSVTPPSAVHAPHSNDTIDINVSQSQSIKLRTGAKALRLLVPSQPSHPQPAHSVSMQIDVPASNPTETATQIQLQDMHGHQPVGPAPQPTDTTVPQVYVPQAGDVEAGIQQAGLLRRKPGKGDATLSLSCSDKLARWSCCGLQGACLSGLLAAPLYLTSLVVAMTPEVAAAGEQVQEGVHAAVFRAVGGRLTGHVESCLPAPYQLTTPQVHLVPPPSDSLGLCSSTQRKTGAGSSINWVAAVGGCDPDMAGKQLTAREGSQEVTLGSMGHKAGASKSALAAGKARSRLCRACMAQEVIKTVAVLEAADIHTGVQSVLAQNAVDEVNKPDNKDSQDGNDSKLTYVGLKVALGRQYQDVWRVLRQQPPFQLWINKPEHLQAFYV